MLELLPVIERIAKSLSKKHHHDADDLQGQGNLMLVQLTNQQLDTPLIIVKIKFGLIQWMAQDRLIPMNYKRLMSKPLKHNQIEEQFGAIEPHKLIDVQDQLKCLPETPNEQAFIELKMEGFIDEEVAEKIDLAIGTIRNMKTRLRNRYDAMDNSLVHNDVRCDHNLCNV